MVFDVDLGFVNVDVMFGICFKCNLGYVLVGECEFKDVIVEGLYGICIIFVMFGM